MSETLYRFRFDCGRMGALHGIFVATPEDIQKLVGAELYFGEVLGKHSEIFGTFQESQVTPLTDDAAFIEKAKAYAIVPTGFNPFEYLEDE